MTEDMAPLAEDTSADELELEPPTVTEPAELPDDVPDDDIAPQEEEPA